MQRHYDEDEEEIEEEEEIDIDSIDDEQTLIDLLDETEDIDERKRIRSRLLKVQYEIKAQREQARQNRENEREMALRKKIKDAEEKKKQTLAMYDQMAKTSSPGTKRFQTDSSGKPRDLVEEAIRDRLKAAEDRKQRILAAYDHAARTQPAGQPRIVEFDAFKSADVSKLEKPKPVGGCCFSMSGGVPKVEKVVAPKTPKVDESYLDHNERSIRERVREADERKRRTLAAYDMASKTGGGGPKVVIVEEFINSDGIPNADPQLEKAKTAKPSCCFSMSNGIPRVDKVKLTVPKTPPIDESQLDPMERFIRARKREADERKRATLAAYDMAAKTGGGGPKEGVLDDFRNLKVSEPPKPRYDPCFQGFKV